MRPSCKVEATQTLLGTSGGRVWEEAARKARLKEMKGGEGKDNSRTRQSKANASELMLLHKRDGAIIRHPPGLPPNYYRRNKRATKKPGRLLLPGKNSSLL